MPLRRMLALQLSLSPVVTHLAAVVEPPVELQSGFILYSSSSSSSSSSSEINEPCTTVPQPCPSKPGVTFCVSDPAPGQCDRKMPHMPCPPCPPPPSANATGTPHISLSPIWSVDIDPPCSTSDYIVGVSRAVRDGIAIKHGAVESPVVEQLPLIADGGTGHAGAPAWCANPCPAGSIPLTSYWSEALQDTLTTAKTPPAGAGYDPVHVEGYCFKSKPAASVGPSTELLQLWSSARNDSFLVLAGGKWAGIAKAQGYIVRSTECWLLTPAPTNCRDGKGCGGTGLWTAWPSEPPTADYSNPGEIPWPKSLDLLSWEYKSGVNPGYGGITHWGKDLGGPSDVATSADTWYPSWSSDGNMYSPWTDGSVRDGDTGKVVSSASTGGAEAGYNCTTGQATIVGDDPFALNITHVKTFTSSSYPYRARYPCGSLVVNGTWFQGTYYVNEPDTCVGDTCVGPNPMPFAGNWGVQGPVASFRHSTDLGRTWHEPKMNATDGGRDNLFGETAANNSRVKFGSPHWVDFGQNMAHSPDGKAYLIGHGATSPSSHQAWMLGDQVYMARVVPTVANISDRSHYEFYAGGVGDEAQWVRGNVSAAAPLLNWTNHTGVVTMSYFHGLRKYVMVVSTVSVYPFTNRAFDTYFLESDSITGPWSYITYMRSFGPEAYFVNHPTKFLAKQADTVAQTFTAFLMYSANFACCSGVPARPPNSGYHMNLQAARFNLSSAFSQRLAATYAAVSDDNHHREQI